MPKALLPQKGPRKRPGGKAASKTTKSTKKMNHILQRQQRPIVISFDEGYQRLLDFHRIHGHCQVSVRQNEDRFLQTWVTWLRQNRDKLTQHQQSRLQGLGFAWETKTHKKGNNWDANLERLQTFFRKHGHFQVDDDPDLNSWVSLQTSLWEQGKLNRGRRQKLTAIGYVVAPVGTVSTTSTPAGIRSNSNNNASGEQQPLQNQLALQREREQWEAMYSKLEQFQLENGRIDVPPSTPALGRWISLQQNRSKKGLLTHDQAQKLLASNISLPTEENREWNKYYQEFIGYVDQHGHGYVVTSGSAIIVSPGLADWVKIQRLYKAHGVILPSRQHWLNVLGFVWKPTKWMLVPTKWGEQKAQQHDSTVEFGHEQKLRIVLSNVEKTPPLGHEGITGTSSSGKRKVLRVKFKRAGGKSRDEQKEVKKSQPPHETTCCKADTLSEKLQGRLDKMTEDAHPDATGQDDQLGPQQTVHNQRGTGHPIEWDDIDPNLFKYIMDLEEGLQEESTGTKQLEDSVTGSCIAVPNTVPLAAGHMGMTSPRRVSIDCDETSQPEQLHAERPCQESTQRVRQVSFAHFVDFADPKSSAREISSIAGDRENESSCVISSDEASFYRPEISDVREDEWLELTTSTFDPFSTEGQEQVAQNIRSINVIPSRFLGTDTRACGTYFPAPPDGGRRRESYKVVHLYPNFYAM